MHSLLEALSAPLRYVVTPTRRIHWLFLASSLLLALALYLWRRDRVHVPLRHRSVWLDVQLLFGNSMVRALLVAPLLVSALAVVTEVARAWRWLLGAPAPSAASHLVVAASYTLALFLFDDLTRYLLHRALHRVPLLWRFHKIHHSAEVLTPLTLYRVHPLESLLYGLRAALCVGFVTGTFYHFFPGRLSQLEVLGINALSFVFSLLGANLRHSHVWLGYGRVLERLFISPAQHQIHHSAEHRHHDANFGTFIALWDLIGRSLRFSADGAPERFGLGADKHHDDNLLSAYIAPFAEVGRRAARLFKARGSA
ncbi:MAG: sterol desaturase family protein [Myxococcales bacterium]|nr:sterol desaturase family protein [Myxococcales bacterium]